MLQISEKYNYTGRKNYNIFRLIFNPCYNLVILVLRKCRNDKNIIRKVKILQDIIEGK